MTNMRYARGPRTLCNGPETPTQWKSETVAPQYLPTNLLTGVGARDAYASNHRGSARDA